MSNAFTHGVQSGKVTTLEEFATTCASAFGVYVEYKDDPINSPRPKRLEIDPYQAELITRAEDDLIYWENITSVELEPIMRREKNEMAVDQYESALRQKESRKNYENMLSQVDNWNVPSEEHEEFKLFMQKELANAMSFDLQAKYSDDEIEEMKNIIMPINAHYLPEEIEEFRADKLEHAQRQLALYRVNYTRHVEEIAKKNKWLELFYDSFEKK